MSHNQNIVRLLKDREGPEVGSPSSSTDKEASTSTTSAVLATGTPGNGPSVGQSATVQVVNTGDNIFLIEDGKPQILGWEAPDSVRITSIEWLYYEGSHKPDRRSELSGKDSGFHSISLATLQGEFFVSLPNYIEVDREKQVITFNAQNDMTRDQFHPDTVQSVLFKWEKDGDVPGSSYLPFFAFTFPDSSMTESDLQNDIVSVATDEGCIDGCDRGETGGDLLAGDGSASDSPQTTPSSGLPESNDSETGGTGSGGGGLAAGAIAGIAVGAVAGLAIIGVLIFLFLRRRKSKQRAGFSDTQQTSDAFISDKTEQAQNADSPRSPYSDDGNQPGHLGSPGPTTAAGAVASTHHGSIAGDSPRPKFSSYQDTRSIDGASNGAQTPQGVSRNVAHLVEEGMTQDDIRRLEEEERALDDAIERAGRR